MGLDGVGQLTDTFARTVKIDGSAGFSSAICFKPSPKTILQITHKLIEPSILGFAFPDHIADIQSPNYRPALVVLPHFNPPTRLDPVGNCWIALLKRSVF